MRKKSLPNSLPQIVPRRSIAFIEIICRGLVPISLALISGCSILHRDVGIKSQTSLATTRNTESSASKEFAEYARNAMRREAWRDALAYWEVAALLRPNNDEINSAIRETRQQLNFQINRALADANKAQHEGRYDQAENALLRLVVLDPTNSEALRRLRQIESVQVKANQVAKLEKTRRFYVSADGRAPTESPSMGNDNSQPLGMELLEQGKIDEAIAEFKSRLAQKPNDKRTKYNLAQAMLMLAEEQEKDGDNEKALQNYNQAKLHGALNRVEYYKRTEAVKQKLAEYYYNQGLSAYREDLHKAITMFEKALSFNSSHAASALKLKQARAMQKNLQRFSEQ